MTRINCVNPRLLVQQHLVAEYRELPRIFWLVQNAIKRGETAERARTLSPPTYTLGTGHCRFFYTRLSWLADRFEKALVPEMQARGYNPTHTTIPDWAYSIPEDWFGDWQPTSTCVAINVERINLRLRGMGMPENQISILPLNR